MIKANSSLGASTRAQRIRTNVVAYSVKSRTSWAACGTTSHRYPAWFDLEFETCSCVRAFISFFQQFLFSRNWIINVVFYVNCRNSRALIGWFLLSIYGQTHQFEIYTTRQRARVGDSTICYRKKNKLMPVFNESVLLLRMNFVITLSK